MRDGACKRLGLCAAIAVAAGLYLKPAPAQEYYGGYGAANPGSGSYLNQATDAQTTGYGQYGELDRRLRALEANWGGNAAVDEACKEIDIQTKPDHKFRGRMFFDVIAKEDMPPFGPLENETGFDTIRLGVQGNIYENLAYSVEFEFEGTEVDFKDVYGEFQNLPYAGNFRIGHFKEPVGLEELTSSRFDTFMEQTFVSDVFVPGRNHGAMAYNYIRENENLSWYLGIFRADSDDSPDGGGTDLNDSNDVSVSGRLVWLPYYDEPSEGRYLMHVGGSYSYRNVSDPELDFSGNGVELGRQGSGVSAILAGDDDYSLGGLEFAVVNGPAHVMAELFAADTSDAQFWGTYVEVGYFLTGEHRGYKRDTKAFDRVQVYEPFFAVRTADGVCRGRGAWQLAARWDYIDLSDPGATLTGFPGTQNNIAAGVNWYLNPYSRVMLNWIHNDYNLAGAANDNETDQLGLRFQIDW